MEGAEVVSAYQFNIVSASRPVQQFFGMALKYLTQDRDLTWPSRSFFTFLLVGLQHLLCLEKS